MATGDPSVHETSIQSGEFFGRILGVSVNSCQPFHGKKMSAIWKNPQWHLPFYSHQSG